MSDMIKIAKDFQYAINIAYDAEDSNKIKNYIFTAASLDLLKKLFNSVIEDTSDKSHFLIGPYGKGKSHLALVLLNLLTLNNSDSIISVKKQIASLDKTFAEDIENYYRENKAFIPVIIENNGNSSLQQCFLNSLRKALISKELQSIIPNTYFTCALNTIASWKDNYENTYNEFCKKLDCNISEFIEDLENYNENAYSKFVKIYPELTAGSNYYPDINNSTLDFYLDVSKKVSKLGYKGIYVVFDEFSKYLEANLDNNYSEDLKFLQDFAEASNRSKKNQLHLLLITHQSLLNYVDKLTKTQIDNWKAVSNRFSELHLNTTISQYYKLISKIIIKDKVQFDNFYKKHNDVFDSIINKWTLKKCFNDYTKDELLEIVKDAFPLHPSSLYILPTLSEKIAQNERTIFTFLASDTQLNTLNEFIKKHNFSREENISLVTPDILFDYFSPLFEEESFKSEIFRTNKKVLAALNQLPDSSDYDLHRKVIKTIGVLNIIDSTDVLSVTEDTICDIYNEPETINVLLYLTKKRIIQKFEYAQTISFPEYAEIDINSDILNKVSIIKRTKNIQSILTEYVQRKAFYPVQYNEDNGITRFLRIEFINADDITLERYKSELKENFADGIIYCVLGNNLNNIESIKETGFVCITLKKQPEFLDDYVYKYEAAKFLKEKVEDSVTKEIIESVKKDYGNFIEHLFNMYFSFNENIAEYYVSGNQINIKNKIEFAELLSEQYSRKYIDFPVILNEMINKNEITTQTVGKCKNIFDNLYKQEKIIQFLGFNPGSQETTIIKSVFVKPGVITEINGEYSFEPISNVVKERNLNLYKVFVHIEEYLTNSNNLTFENLYIELREKFGIRKGIIPLLLGAIFYRHKNNLYFIRDGIEYSVNSDVIYFINEKPASFSFNFAKTDAESQIYINGLKQLFNEYLGYVEKKLSENDRLVKAMSKWYVALPSYTKSNLKGKAKELLKPLGAMKVNTNQYLFDVVPKVLNVETAQLAKEFAEIVKEENDFINKQINKIQNALFELFDAKDVDTLDKNISNWYQSLSPETKNHVYGDYISNIFTVFGQKRNTIEEFIRELIIKDFGIRIEDWNKNYSKDGEDTCDYFIEKLNNFKLSYDRFQEKLDNLKRMEDQEGMNVLSLAPYAIQFPGKEKKARIIKSFDFDSDKINKQSAAYRFLMNEMKNDISSYQSSLTAEEKCDVLFTIMKEILGL